MSRIQKSSLTVDGNSIHMSMPFAKVDESKRTVSGFATLDNIDTEGDVVLSEASVKAFQRARGNLREMHQPVAVGKVIDFQEEEFYDSKNDELYRGIFVTARVSEGAEDTWKKVLDGTLTGFSIGGAINEASNEFIKDANRTIRFIKDYDLVELSLVDNPANQLANIVSFQKSQTGDLIVKMGEAGTAQVESVFVCSKDFTVVVKNADMASCPECDSVMEQAGWFESAGDRKEKVRSIVNKFLNGKEAAPNSESEGGVDMTVKDEEVTKGANPEGEPVIDPNPSEPNDEQPIPPADAVDAADVDETEGTDEEETEEVDPDETTDETEVIAKKIDELKDAVTTSLEESKQETLAKVAELEKRLDTATEELTKKTSEIEEKINDFGNKLETAKTRLTDLENGLEKMNSSEAIKKSADVDKTDAGKDVQDTFWNNAFSGKPQGFSVDNL
jgi:hypothetical protein